jgi:Dyp-type peroxidase family
MSTLQVEDIQGIILHGYGRLRSACFLLLCITKPAAAQAWLKTLDVRNAQVKPDQTDRCINIAFTRAGLEKLGLAEKLTQQFAGEFCEGMTATEHRQRILGDIDDSGPERWQWGGTRSPQPHILLMLYAGDPDALSALVAEQQADFSNTGLELLTLLDSSWLPHGKEHFGFRDGVSSTGIEGFDTGVSPGNTIAPGEFILGYPNAYGQYTHRPLVDPDQDPESILPEAPDDSRQRDLGMNGSYLVFRHLSQDVAGFWKFIDEKTTPIGGSPNPDARIKLAAKMVGRWPSGTPLVKSPDVDDPSLCDDNEFLYHGSDDRHGFKCPIGAHIRRSNPRDSLEPEPGSERSIEVGKRHRILRRGRTYGAPVASSMEIADILAAGGLTGERGLHFICFNTHIGRQFEFIQHTWVNNPKFDGLYEDDDPLVGDRGGARGGRGGTFTMQAEPIRTRVTAMPRFVQVRGGAYFFMPGLRALRFLASMRGNAGE